MLARKVQPGLIARHRWRTDDAAIHKPRPALFQQARDAQCAFGRDGVRIEIRALIGKPRTCSAMSSANSGGQTLTISGQSSAQIRERPGVLEACLGCAFCVAALRPSETQNTLFPLLRAETATTIPICPGCRIPMR